jgi:AcrR family transcriptional regulator
MVSSLKSKTDVVAEFRSAEIMEAARQVFARRGYSETTMDEIAEAAGVAKGTLYLYFKSKRALYLAALKHGISELNTQTRRAVDNARGVREKIRAFIATRVEYADENRQFCKIYYSELGNLVHPVPTQAEFKKMYMQQADFMTSILQAAEECGEIRPGLARQAALMIYDATRGINARRLLGWTKEDRAREVDDVCELVWRGVAPS